MNSFWGGLLEYLRVFLSWPPLIALALFYFMISHKDAIDRLIDRIKGFTFPGGVIDTEIKYTPDLPNIKKDQVASTPIREEKDSIQLKRLDILEKDFNSFIFHDLLSNRNILHKLITAIWKKSGHGLFKAHTTPTISDMLIDIKSRIDPKAVEDFKDIENTVGTQNLTREEIIKTYIKSKLLADYFRSLVTRRQYI